MILITGASGQVGCAVIQALHQKNIPIRAFIHNRKNKEKVIKAGASEVFIGDMNNQNDLKDAMIGIDTVYFICPAANPDEDKMGEKIINLAKEEDELYFIYHSVLHSILEDMPHHQKKLRVEQLLVDSGLNYTIIQPAVFMHMLKPAIQSVKNGGPLVQKFYTSNDTRMNFVDVNDMAEAVATIISTHDYINTTLELCGGKNYSPDDLMNTFSEAFKRDVLMQYIPDDVFLKQATLDKNSYPAETLLTMFKHYNRHSFCGNSFTISNILGRKPTSLLDFIKKTLNEI